MNRKATFAKRQRESDLKDHARQKEARKAARQTNTRTGKGPEIAWDEAVYATAPGPDDEPGVASTNPTDDSVDSNSPRADAAAAPSGGGNGGGSSSGGGGSSGSTVPTDDSP